MSTVVEPAFGVAPVVELPHASLSAAERLNRPSVAVAYNELGYHAVVDPVDVRVVLDVECQLHLDLNYLVTRAGHNEYQLWRMEHAGLAPARLTGEIKQRMLSAPGTIKRWTTGDHQIHELEVEGRHDLQATVLLYPEDSTIPPVTTYISLGTSKLTDSAWLRIWVVMLENGRRITSSGEHYATTRVIRL